MACAAVGGSPQGYPYKSNDELRQGGGKGKGVVDTDTHRKAGVQLIFCGATSIVPCILKVELKSISNVFYTTPLKDCLNRKRRCCQQYQEQPAPASPRHRGGQSLQP